ncbi:MAG: VanZ family protein [Filifactoraceae bacterium]
MGIKKEIISLFLVYVVIYFMGLFVIRKESAIVKSRVIKNIFKIYFLGYVFLLLKYTMFDGNFGREIGLIENFGNLKNAFKEYINSRTNFKLLQTIESYTKAFVNGRLSLRLYIINIFGNIVAFVPFALFLPILYKRSKTFWFFFMQVLIIGVLIETIQILLMTGSFDIDDILLNVIGALIAYKIFHTKTIYNILSRITKKNY